MLCWSYWALEAGAVEAERAERRGRDGGGAMAAAETRDGAVDAGSTMLGCDDG